MPRPHHIPLFDASAERAALGPAILTEIQSVITSGAFILGPTVTAAEAALLAYLNATIPASPPTPTAAPLHCIGLSSGTDALHLALRALHLTPAHSVVTTSFTWLSTATAIPLSGARPLFADISPDTYCLSPASVTRAIRPCTRAVIAVSLFGRVADLRALRAVIDTAAAAHGTRIALIEDGAQSYGGVGADGWPSCASPDADMAVTSFFPSKPLGCYGDGGALFTRRPELACAVRELRGHGKDAAGRYVRLGLNARLDALQAAVLLAKLPEFPGMVARRVDVGRRYAEGLAGDGRIVLPEVGDGASVHVFGVYTVRVRERDEVARMMRAAGIGCGVYYGVCVHQQPLFAGGEGREGLVMESAPMESAPVLAVAEHVAKYVLSLPVHAYLRADDQKVVIAALRDALDKAGVMEQPPTAPSVAKP